jgi:2-polyprenyl-3-methyl-5-hydroxy-6-metoxy-1,4-benzoquinol methylase
MTSTPGPETVRQQVSEGFAAAADGYDTTGTEFFTVLGEHLAADAQIPVGARVLDVGCGKGAVSLPAARAAGPDGHVTGIDLAPGMLAYADGRARHAGLSNVTFQAGDAEDPAASGRWGPGSFDVILAGNVIQFLPQPERAVRAWHQLLTPAGTVAVSWTVAEDPRWLRVIATFDTALPAQVTGFKALLRRAPFGCEDELEALLADTGFGAPATVLHRITMTYRSPQQWWQAARSQGPWAVAWRHIPPGRLPAAQSQAFALLEGLREPDGTLIRTITFACTSARSGDPGAGR